jgi:hypothetical protein
MNSTTRRFSLTRLTKLSSKRVTKNVHVAVLLQICCTRRLFSGVAEGGIELPTRVIR